MVIKHLSIVASTLIAIIFSKMQFVKTITVAIWLSGLMLCPGDAVAQLRSIDSTEPIPKKLALLIGIDNYMDPEIEPLSGAKNDVDLMKKVLVDQYEFLEENILVLLNSEATRERIIESIQDHLISRSNQGDVIVIHFSGYGSQMKDINGDEPDGWDESLVAYDSRTEGVFDISDDEINGLFQLLSEKTLNVNFILDAGHYSVASRASKIKRHILPDERDPPPPPPYISNSPSSSELPMYQLGTDITWMSAASRLSADAFEDSFNDISYGVFTFYLAQELLLSSSSVSYRDLFERASLKINVRYPSQNPTLEGLNVEAAVFEHSSSITKTYLVASLVGNERVEISGGKALGVFPGSKYGLYANDGNSDTLSDSLIALVEVQDVGPFKSLASIIEGRDIPEKTLALLIEDSFPVRERKNYNFRSVGNYQYYALLVGVGKYQDPGIGDLSGPVNKDIPRLKTALSDQVFGLFDEENIIVISDSQATRENILLAVDQIRSRMQPNDIFFMHWSGHSNYDNIEDELYLSPFNYKIEDDKNAILLYEDVLTRFDYKNQAFVFSGDGCQIGAGLLSKVNSVESKISLLGAAKQDEIAYEFHDIGGAYSYFLADGLSKAQDLDNNGYISVEELFHHTYYKVVNYFSEKGSSTLQHPSISGRYVHRIQLARKNPSIEQEYIVKEVIEGIALNELAFASEVPAEINLGESIWINGYEREVKEIDKAQMKIRFLGSTDSTNLLKKGLNAIRTLKKEYLFWQESKKLVEYQTPYDNSHAILIAISDYERKRDPLKRGKTGYDELQFMVKDARELKKRLLGLGFPERNIKELYNEEATSMNIDSELKKFWKGGTHDRADRLFIYFGGHGDSDDGRGFLITYDYDDRQPTLSSVLMKDLSGRHAENIEAHHVLIALDACDSGLALFKNQGNNDGTDGANLEDFRTLSIIRSDTEEKARNILLAGTGNQRAVYDDGGIFTKALANGLEGSADTNQDGLIQFLELSNYVRNQVNIEASKLNVRQEPTHYVLDGLGSGRVLFVMKQ